MGNYTIFRNQLLEELEKRSAEGFAFAYEVVSPAVVKGDCEEYIEFGNGNIRPRVAISAIQEDCVRNGMTVGKAVENLFKAVNRREEMDSIQAFIEKMDADYILKNLVLAVVDVAGNEEWLDGLVHRNEAVGLASYMRVLVPHLEGSIPVKHGFLERYGISAEEAFLTARGNVFSGARICLVSDGGYDRVARFEELNTLKLRRIVRRAQEGYLLVVSGVNDTAFGAAFLADKTMLQYLADGFEDETFCIIPSSVHECILVPDLDEWELECAHAMVHDINRAMVDPKERLSDDIFRYSTEGGLERL